MKYIRTVLLLLFFSLSVTTVFSQEFGAVPVAVKWKQINVPEARIIFPAELDTTAQRIAGIVHYLNKYTGNTAGDAHRKINIVLHNQTTQSNGYVGLAPWRSEFMLMPPVNNFELGSLPWADNLALHEYRHVQQYMNYRKGLSKLAYFLLGEQGQAVANNAAVPNWFFEGDAVFQETAASGQGRGRLPLFFNGYRSLWAAGKKYSFMKLRNGSLKHYIPDHYSLGYLLTGYGREKFGEQFWNKVTRDAAAYEDLFYPFQKSVKRHAGVNYSEFVKDAFRYYKSQSLLFSDDTLITKGNNRFVSDYSYPYYAGRDSLIVQKRTYRDIPAWWMKTPTGEKKIRTKDISRNDFYTYRNNKIVYTAYKPDIRWGRRDYSEIKVLDVPTGRTVRLTRRSRYYQPDLSEDGSRIIAVTYTPEQKSELHLLDAALGTLLYNVPVSKEQSYIYTYPKFYDRDHIIACVRNKDGQMNLSRINLNTGEMVNLLPWSFAIKGYPLVKADTVYFSSGNGYQDDIFALNIKTGTLFKLTNQPFGAYQAAINDQKKLVWSSFSESGMQLKEKQLKEEDWKPAPVSTSLYAADLYLPQALQQTGGNILSGIPDVRHETTRYGKLSSPFNFHSWRPFYEPPEWSFTFYGQNILNTFQSQLYYAFNENEGSHKAGFDGVYGAWFPWVTGGISYTLNRKESDTIRTIRWNELNANMGIRVPLNFTGGQWYRNLVFASSFNVEQLHVTGIYKDSIAGPLFNYMQYSLNWGSQIQKAVQHINPRFAQSFLLRYRHMVTKDRAQQLLASGTLFFPGIGINHSLVINGAFQWRDTVNRYRFPNNFPFARGYHGVDMPRMWKGGINYHFPLVYPDWGFAHIVYFLRLRGNIFFDFVGAMNRVWNNVYTFRSAGAELFFDTKWWNQQPVTFGFRYSYLLDKNMGGTGNAGKWEFILPVDLFSR